MVFIKFKEQLSLSITMVDIFLTVIIKKYIAQDWIQRVIEGTDSTEGMVQISGINQLGHH